MWENNGKKKCRVTRIIIHMKKLLDSNWLSAVQFKCNTGAKSVTPECKLHIDRDSGL